MWMKNYITFQYNTHIHTLFLNYTHTHTTHTKLKKIIFCFSIFAARDEITHAIKDIAKGIKHTDILPEDINEDLITDCLYSYKSPKPDLLIRTSGETRLSDFLMWQVRKLISFS